MSGGGDREQTSTMEPWEGQQYYLHHQLGNARDRFIQAEGYGNYPEFSTVAPFNPVQESAQQQALTYADSLQPYIAGVGETYQQLVNPASNPVYANTMGTQGTYQNYLMDVMGRELPDVEAIGRNIAGSSLVASGNRYGDVGDIPTAQIRDIDTRPFAQVVDLNAPQIDFNPTTAQNQNLNAALEQMLSGETNMDIWAPLMEQTSRNMTREFTEQVLPHVRNEAIAAGAYGQSMGMRGTGLAADRFSENMAESMERLASQGALLAAQQQGLGAQVSAQMYGQDLQAELSRALAQGELDIGSLRLQEQQRASREMENLARQELGVSRDAQLSNLNLQAADLRERMGLERDRLGFAADQWRDQLGLQGAQLGLQRYQTDLNAGLQAAGALSNEVQNMYNQGLAAQGRAMEFAPTYAQLGLMPSSIYETVGAQQQQQAQALLDEDVARFWAEHPTLGTQGQNLDWYRNAIQIPGNYGTATEPYSSGSPVMGALGGAALGAGTMAAGANAGMLTGSLAGPPGMLLGAGIGALGGYFGSR